MRGILRVLRCLVRMIYPLATGIAVACNGPLYMETLYEYPAPGQNQEPSEGEGQEPEVPEPAVRELFVTGLEFPDNYQWKPEIGSGSVQAVLFLMKDGKRIVEIPTGEAHHVSIDADMHKCVDGHLFTTYYSNGRVFIKKDGAEVLEYEAMERIYSIVSENGRIYTLGRTADGNGFVFRCDGKNILEKHDAETMPQGMYSDNGSIVFAYKEKISVGSSGIYRYYYAVDGTPHTINHGSDVTGIDDVRLVDGKLYYTAKTADNYSFYYFAEDKSEKVKASGIAEPATLIFDGKEMFIYAEVPNAFPHSVFWRGADWLTNSPSNHRTLAAKASDGCLHYIHAPLGQISELQISNSGADTSGLIAPEYEMLFKDCFDIMPGKCCIALHSPADSRPVIWENGFAEVHDFNGFFTGVYYQ